MGFSIRNVLSRVPWGLVLASLPVLFLMAVMANYYRDMISDDAFISFRYAAKLASGQGLEWNPGYKIEGYSNFLWVVVLALLNLLGASIPMAAGVLAWLAAAGAVVLVVSTANLERGRRPNWALAALAPLPLVVSFPYIWWVSMRLETAAFGTLILLAILLFAREEERGDEEGGRPWGSAVPLLALVLLRPEGPAFIGVPLLYLALQLRSRGDLVQLIRRRWIWALIWAGGGLVYHGWRVAYFGELLPNTYHAKVVGSDQLSEGWIYLRRLATERPMHVALACAPFLMGALASRAGKLLLGAAALLVAVVVVEGGDWMREWRLFQPVLPLLVAAMGVGLQRAASWGKGGAAAAVIGMLILCAGVHNHMGTPRSEWSAALKGERRDILINMEGELTRASKEVADWLRKNARPTDLVAVNHAGALPYYSGLPTLDMAGLNDKHIARLPGLGVVHTKWDSDYLLGRKPAFIVLNTKAFPHNFQYVPGYWQGETDLTQQAGFRRNYEAVRKVWRWRGLSLSVRDRPQLAGEYFIMIYRRVKDQFKPVGECLDFEGGDWTGWTAAGEAFGPSPVGRRPPPGVREDFIGKFIADSYRGSDAPTGTLRSAPFSLKGDRLELVIGGGGGSGGAGVRLLVDDKEVRRASGKNDHQLRHVRWDVDQFKGKMVQLELYDQGSEEWDHVLADNICQYMKIAE